jgi:hypothetical protein
VIVPLPVPEILVVNVKLDFVSKVAVTFSSRVMGSVHVRLVPVQAPDHPLNVEPTAAVAVNINTEPARYG